MILPMQDQHSVEFKKEAVSFYRYSGKSLEDAASSLSIPINTLKKWISTSTQENNLSPLEQNTLKKIQTITSAASNSIENNQTLAGSFFGAWMGSKDEEEIEEPMPAENSCFSAPFLEWHSEDLDIGKTLGEGGMGIVHSALQNSMGRHVAIKEVRNEVSSPHTIKTLLQEAWITGFLEHPNIVPIYDISKNKRDEPIILMKQISGNDWAEFFKNPRLVQERNVTHDILMWHFDVFDQVSNAVHYAHSRGIIHRDLKPDNIMIGNYGEVYVLDWGIAIALDDRHSSWIPRASEARRTTGSPWYMAPEMIGGDGHKLSIQTDIYLLGAILYELVTGSPPHKGSALPEILQSIPDFKPEFPDHVSSSLQEIISKALSKDPKDRHDDVEQLRMEIQRYKEYRELKRIENNIQIEIDSLDAHLKQNSEQNMIYEHYFSARFGVEQIRKHHLDTSSFSIEDDFHKISLLIIEWELENNRPDSAKLAMASLLKDEPEYHEKISQALTEKDNQAKDLRKLEVAYSKTIGVRTRFFVMFLVVIGWISYPFVIWQFEIEMSYFNLNTQTGAMLILLFTIGIWARNSLSSTKLNSHTFAFLLTEPLLHLVADMSAYSIGWNPEQAWSLRVLVWTTMLSSYALLIDTRLILISIFYALSTLFVFAFPEYLLAFSIGSNVLLLLTLIFLAIPALKKSEDARKLNKDDIL